MSVRAVRVENIAISDDALIVRLLRIDTAPGEPESLRAEHRLVPGESILLQIPAGACIAITEEPSHG